MEIFQVFGLLLVLFLISVILYYIYLETTLAQPDSKYKPILNEEHKQALASPKATAPENAIEETNNEKKINYGVYLKPILNTNLKAGYKNFRLKCWQFQSINTPDWFFGIAIINLHYVGQAFVYALEKSTGNKYEYEQISLRSAAIKKCNSSSVVGTTLWQHKNTTIQSTYDDAIGGYRIQLNVDLHCSPIKKKIKLEGSFSSVRPKNGDDLALLFPLLPDQPAYTHKTPLQVVDGSIYIDGKEINILNSPSALDWTKSVEFRITKWKWASFSGLSKGRDNILVNLTGSGRFLDKENAIWVNDKMYPLGEVTFHNSNEKGKQWKCITSSTHSLSAPQINIFFDPVNDKKLRLNLLVAADRFIQSIGKFRGTITLPQLNQKTIQFEEIWGVGETHVAVW